MASNVHSIVEKYSCNSHSKACIIRECEDCTSDKILNFDGFDGKKDVKFFKWCRENKNTEKKLKRPINVTKPLKHGHHQS